jgi:hypothetical protein
MGLRVVVVWGSEPIEQKAASGLVAADSGVPNRLKRLLQ